MLVDQPEQRPLGDSLKQIHVLVVHFYEVASMNDVVPLFCKVIENV
jgi:hypothetical protein